MEETSTTPSVGARPSPQADDILAALEAEQYLRTYERAKFFDPYPTQRKFIAASADHFELLLSAGNGTGKTEVGAYVTAAHLTGEYPPWWEGRRWNRPIDAWVCGQSADALREAAQLKLCGRLGEDGWGTGMIPRRCLGKVEKARGVAGCIDALEVRHISGGVSHLYFKQYTQEPSNWQGPRLDLVWFDEEPKTLPHYTEAIARLMGRNGISYLTFTPLAGPTEVVKRFVDDTEPTRAYFTMSMDEAAHISAEEKARKFREYPPNERDARYHGRISLGEGAVYEVPEADLIVDVPLAQVPLHWVKIWGIDFGIDHPFAAALYAWDRETDEHYILAEIRMRDAIPLQHADAIRRIAANVPVAWPRDGVNREKSSGQPLAASYRQFGLQMLNEHATWPAGGYSLYAGITELHNLMQARRWHVNRSCRDWFGEYRMYHFRDGKIVPRDDDLLDASRYAYMMRRRAKPVPLGGAIGRTRLLARRPTAAPLCDPWSGLPIRP